MENWERVTGFDHLGPASIKPLQFSYWVGVAEALEAMGVEVLIGRVPASASIEERAKVLCEMIGERFPGREVNLIGHSMVSSCLLNRDHCQLFSDLTHQNLLSSGRVRRSFPDLATQTDQFQSPFAHNDLDSSPWFFFRRFPAGRCRWQVSSANDAQRIVCSRDSGRRCCVR